MRSLEHRFNKSKNTTTITKFCDAILYQNYSKRTIQRYFNKLVDPEDYAKEEKMQILKDCYRKTQKKKVEKSGQISSPTFSVIKY